MQKWAAIHCFFFSPKSFHNGVENAAGNVVEAGSLDFYLHDTTSTNEDATFEVKLRTAGNAPTAALSITTGLLTMSGGLQINSGTVTQSTNLQTGVTLNKHSGIITTATASTAGSSCESFPFVNDKMLGTECMFVSVRKYSGTFGANGIPVVSATSFGEGTATITVCNVHPSNSLSGTIEINFVIIRQ